MESAPATNHVHDPRHRYSYELRPAAELDRRMRAVAAGLEWNGLIPEGASTAPRFHPHVTLMRAAVADERAADAAADALRAASGVEVEFRTLDVFGKGRIVYVEPADRAPFDAARAALLRVLPEGEVDPLALARPLTPHVTLAYAVPEATRIAAQQFVARALPLVGRWASFEIWDLDVRPTRLMHRALLD